MPARRVAALQSIAAAIASGELVLPERGPSTPDFRAALLALPGIGPWTVEYFFLRGLADADAWPGSDLVLKRAVESFGRGPSHPDRWRPFRGYAAMHLWRAASEAATAGG